MPFQGCFLPDMLEVAAGGCGARGQSFGAPADGPLGLHAGAVERATTVIGYVVNKPVKSSLHSENVKIKKKLILDSSISLKIKNKMAKKKQLENFFNNMDFTQKKIHNLGVTKPFLNPEGHQNCIIGSKVTAILLNW